MIFFGSNDNPNCFFDTEHQLESIFGDFQFKSAKPMIRVQWRLTIFLFQIYFPVNESGNAGNETIPFFHFSLTIDEKNRFRKRNLVRFFIFICCQKKIGDATKCFFVAATLPKPKKLITLKEIPFNAATILLQRCQATKI